MNLPNKITIARILLVPIMMIIPYIAPYIGLSGTILYGVPISNVIVLIIFLVASLTDYLDGHLARKNNMVTNFGKFLDPIADKVLVFAALMILVETGIIPGWIVTITAAREFMVAAIRMLVAKEGTVIAASKLGKIKTVTQMVAISLALIDTHSMMAFVNGSLQGFALVLNILMSIAMVASVITTIWSGTDYFMKSKEVVLQSK